MVARIEGLMREFMAPPTLSPVRFHSRQPATTNVQEEQQMIDRQSRREAVKAARHSERESIKLEDPTKHPVLKCYYQSPHVDAAAKHEERERERASERSGARRQSHR
jgi:hypothetical protein